MQSNRDRRDDRLAEPKRREARRLVGLGRLELPTSRLSSARSNQLSYKPESLVPRNNLVLRTVRPLSRMDKERHGLVHERKRNEDGGVLPMDLTDPETGWP